MSVRMDWARIGYINQIGLSIWWLVVAMCPPVSYFPAGALAFAHALFRVLALVNAFGHCQASRVSYRRQTSGACTRAAGRGQTTLPRCSFWTSTRHVATPPLVAALNLHPDADSTSGHSHSACALHMCPHEYQEWRKDATVAEDQHAPPLF